MDLRRVESIGVGRLRKEFHELLPQVEAGVHFLLLRFDKPVAALISHADYLEFSELARQDALAKAVLQGKGYDPASLTVEQYLALLARHVREEA
jgi:antitoxin (DNA-binding transcriptional repressor) of toxin-antitoxin stability system